MIHPGTGELLDLGHRIGNIIQTRGHCSSGRKIKHLYPTPSLGQMKNSQALIVGFYLSKHQKIHRATITLGSFRTVGFIRKWLLNDAKRLEARMNRADSNPDRTDKKRYHHDPHP